MYQISRPGLSSAAGLAANAGVAFLLMVALASPLGAQARPPEIVSISPSTGAEGSRVEVYGRNLQEASSVLFGSVSTVFKVITDDHLVLLVPHRVSTSHISVVTPAGRATSPLPFVVTNDPRIPDEVSYKAGYVNPVPRPSDFSSARLWGIALADTRVPSHESAQVEIAWTQLSCRVDGKDVVLNEDNGRINGGLYVRHPWFGGHDYHEPMPVIYDLHDHAAVLRVGERTDRIWHFWSPSPRAALPSGHLEGCTAKARVKISDGALLQMGFDYWRSTTAIYGPGGNNHEAGASNWYLPSADWQEAAFTDIGGVQF